MRILQLRSSIGFFGAEAMILELSKYLVDNGYETIIGVINNLYNEHLELVETAGLNGIRWKTFDCRSQIDAKAIGTIRMFILAEKIQIIHTHGHKANIYGLLATIGISNLKRLATCHPWIETTPSMRIYSLVDKLLLRRFDKLVAVSGEVEDELYKYKIPKRKVLRINNGVDIDRYDHDYNIAPLYREFHIGKGIVVGTVGRLSSEKGHVTLIEAASSFLKNRDDVTLLIVGDGSSRKNLEILCKKFIVKDKVVFAGIRSDIPELLKLMDIFVLPSWTEGLPMALLEAMASGKPVVASRVGEIPKLVINGFSGILVKPGSVRELRDAIIELVEQKERRQLMGRNAHHTIKSKFSSEHMGREYVSLFNHLADRVSQ